MDSSRASTYVVDNCPAGACRLAWSGGVCAAGRWYGVVTSTRTVRLAISGRDYMLLLPGDSLLHL